MLDPDNVPDKVDELILRARHLMAWGMDEDDIQRQLVRLHGARPEEAINAIAAARTLCKSA